MKANFEKGTKICSSCKREQPIEAYNKCKTTNDGLCYKCRECERAFRQSEKGKEISRKVHQKYRQTEAGKEVAKRARQKYYQTEKGKALQAKSSKNYQQTEKGKETYKKAIKKYNESEHGRLHNEEYRKSKAYRIKQDRYNQSEKGKEARKRGEQNYEQSEKGKITRKNIVRKRIESGKINEYQNKKYEEDEQYRIGKLFRTRIWTALKGFSKSAHSEELLGCSWKELKQHIENQFIDNMSWNNQDKWHIDHIIPCAAFDLTSPIHQRICFNWRNLQPLWAEDNLSKNDSLPEGWQDLLEEIRTALNIDEVVELKKE